MDKKVRRKGFALPCVELALSVIFGVGIMVTIVGFLMGLSTRFESSMLVPDNSLASF